jgi:hypothetical protein
VPGLSEEIRRDPIGFAARLYDVPREMVEGARDHLSVVCTCGHPTDYHGNADGQTGWQARCGHPDCDCEDLDAAS